MYSSESCEAKRTPLFPAGHRRHPPCAPQSSTAWICFRVGPAARARYFLVAGWGRGAVKRRSDVAHVNDAICADRARRAGRSPPVAACRKPGAPPLLSRVRTPRVTNDLCPLEAGLLEQGLQPRLEFFVEIVDEYGGVPKRLSRQSAAVGWYNSQSPPGPTDGLDVDTIATDIGEHIANDAERRDGPGSGPRARARAPPAAGRWSATKRQPKPSAALPPDHRHQSPPGAGGGERDFQTAIPAASTIAGPEREIAVIGEQ